jgi:hypothetical protein
VTFARLSAGSFGCRSTAVETRFLRRDGNAFVRDGTTRRTRHVD